MSHSPFLLQFACARASVGEFIEDFFDEWLIGKRRRRNKKVRAMLFCVCVCVCLWVLAAEKKKTKGPL